MKKKGGLANRGTGVCIGQTGVLGKLALGELVHLANLIRRKIIDPEQQPFTYKKLESDIQPTQGIL